MALRDRLLGVPERLDGPALARAVRHGSEALAARSLRALGERGEDEAVPFLQGFIQDPRAAVRRAAVAALGHLGRPGALPALLAGWGAEGTEEGRLALAVARVRCGEDARQVHAQLLQFEHRTLETCRGRRSPQAATGSPPLEGAFWQRMREEEGAGPVESRAALLTSRRASLVGGHREVITALAALQHPDDYAALSRLLVSAGRREEHAVFAALGILGDPRAVPLLTDALFATDVDPGRGFAQRRLAATALGRLGLRASVRALLRALENEALDFEGRPGAGMGVQYPVRTNLIWALGEIGDPATIPVLVPYLSDTHGSALGGFYLPAMDALRKFGRAAAAPLQRVVAEGAEVEAANAVGVLAAIGEDVRRWERDPRAPVAQVAGMAAKAGGDDA